MRPLVAHCHLGLGKLYRRTGKREQAQEHLATATTMYREMDMRFWLEQAEAARVELERPVPWRAPDRTSVAREHRRRNHWRKRRYPGLRTQVEQMLTPRDGARPPPILLRGETGTGKGLVARTMHRAGPRARAPFVDVNCAAIPETLLEAELFGYERGAFTDARQAKPGLFQTAHGGTLFLDEIGLLPPAMQAKLLKVLEDRAVSAGSAATRASPSTCGWSRPRTRTSTRRYSARRFREDLYHRLAVLRSSCRRCASAETTSSARRALPRRGRAPSTVYP